MGQVGVGGEGGQRCQKAESAPNLPCWRCAFPGHGWVPSNGNGLSQTRAIVYLLGNIPQQVLGVFAEGKVGQVQSCGNGPPPCPSSWDEPHPPFSTWARKGLRGHFPLGGHPFQGLGPQQMVNGVI